MVTTIRVVLPTSITRPASPVHPPRTDFGELRPGLNAGPEADEGSAWLGIRPKTLASAARADDEILAMETLTPIPWPTSPAREVAPVRVVCFMRYALANILYRIRFPSGGISAIDFRPHFGGYLLNATTPIPAGLKADDVEEALSRRLRQSFRWMRLIRFLLRDGDKVQYCLGTLKPAQQYMIAWSSRDDLVANVPPRDVAKYWGVSDGVPAGR